MTPHNSYIHEMTIKIIVNTNHDNIPLLEEERTSKEQKNYTILQEYINQIYQDGYSDGFDERQALGDLN